MSRVDTLGVGLSGLLAFQRAIANASNNIGNVDTAGFNRRSVEFGERSAAGVGAGVGVDAIHRAYDAFLLNDLFARSADANGARTRAGIADDVASLLGDVETGLGAALAPLVPALDAAAADPAALAPRAELLSAIDRAVSRISDFVDNAQGLRSSALARLDADLVAASEIGSAIADLNDRIAGAGPDAVSLLDERDRQLEQLAELVSFTTVPADDGTLSVFIAGEQPLVVRDGATTLRRAGGDPLTVTASRRGVLSDVSAAMRGGRIGGTVAALGGELERATNELDRLALGLATTLNAVHAQGIDLDGNAGGALLTITNDPTLTAGRVQPRIDNSGDASLTLSVDDVGALGVEPLRLAFDGSDWNLLDSSGALLDTFSGFPHAVSAFGFTLDLASGTASAGDDFVLRPASGAGAGLSVLATDPRSLALAAPVDGSFASANVGSAQMTGLTLSALEAGAAATDLLATVTMTYDAANERFDLSAPPGGTLAYVAASASGAETGFTVPGYGTLRFTLEGTPADGDVLTIAARGTGSGDDRNGRALRAALQAPLLDGGRLALVDTASRIVGDVAAAARGHVLDADGAEAIADRTRLARDAVSGVNLDEEAADLLRFQQGYEASARVVAVSGQLFRTLLSAVGG